MRLSRQIGPFSAMWGHSMQKTMGQIAFEAYKEAVSGKAYDDTPIPEWDQVKPEIRLAWELAAQRVINQTLKELASNA